MPRLSVMKRGTRYWVVLSEDKLIYEGITKKSCLRFISEQEKRRRFSNAIPLSEDL